MDAPKPYVEFFVPGKAAGAGSKTIGRNAQGRTWVRPASKATKPWMAIVSSYALQAMTDAQKSAIQTGAVLLWISFWMPRPQSHFRTGAHTGELKENAPHYCISGLDLTKRVRALEDACKGIIWRDDRQVAIQNTSSLYVKDGETPGAHVKVYLLT